MKVESTDITKGANMGCERGASNDTFFFLTWAARKMDQWSAAWGRLWEQAIKLRVSLLDMLYFRNPSKLVGYTCLVFRGRDGTKGRHWELAYGCFLKPETWGGNLCLGAEEVERKTVWG